MLLTRQRHCSKVPLEFSPDECRNKNCGLPEMKRDPVVNEVDLICLIMQCQCLSVSVCLFVCLSACAHVCMPTYLPVCLSVCLQNSKVPDKHMTTFFVHHSHRLSLVYGEHRWHSRHKHRLASLASTPILYAAPDIAILQLCFW